MVWRKKCFGVSILSKKRYNSPWDQETSLLVGHRLKQLQIMGLSVRQQASSVPVFENKFLEEIYLQKKSKLS